MASRIRASQPADQPTSRRRSARKTWSAARRRACRRLRDSSRQVAKLIDVSKCIGCKACQVGVP